MSDATKSAEAYNGEILSTLKKILSKVEAIESRMSAVGAAFAGAKASAPSGNVGGEVATDRDLDGKYGNPTIRKDPKDWQGDSFVGCAYSNAPPEYLDMLAGVLEWKAGKEAAEGKEKYAGYSRADAARARGWAQRKRNGWTCNGVVAPGDAGAEQDDEIPF